MPDRMEQNVAESQLENNFFDPERSIMSQDSSGLQGGPGAKPKMNFIQRNKMLAAQKAASKAQDKRLPTAGMRPASAVRKIRETSQPKRIQAMNTP